MLERHAREFVVVSVLAIVRHLRAALLPLPHVQFWQTENSCRLDSSHRGAHRRDISCLVDASDVRTVNALKTPPAWSMHYERAALLSGVKRDVGQESEEKIGKSAEE